MRRNTEQLVIDHSHAELVQRLQAQDELDTLDACGWSCLHHAAALGLTRHVEGLLDAGTSVGLKTEEATSYPAGLDALGVARHTQTQGWGDRLYICTALQFAEEAAVTDAGQQGWRALYTADVEKRKAEADARDLAKQQEEMEAVAYVQAEAQAKWSIRAELAARERRARGAEQTAEQEAAAHLMYKRRAEELEAQAAQVSAQLADVAQAKQVAEVQLAKTTKEAERAKTKNAALVKSANPLAEQQKKQAVALKDQTAEVERLRATIKSQRDKASKNREKLEIDLHCSRLRERELAAELETERADNEALRKQVASLEAQAEAREMLNERRETEMKEENASLSSKITEASKREHKQLAEWTEVLGAALHSSMEALAIPQFKELVPLTIDTMQTYLGMTRYNTVPPPMPSPPKPAVAYVDRDKQKAEDEAEEKANGGSGSGTKTTRWLLENSLQRRLAIAEHRVAVMNSEATRLRKGLHLSVASAAAGTARAAEAAHVIHAASVAAAEAAAVRDKEQAAAKRDEDVRRQISIEQQRRSKLIAKGLGAPAGGSVEEMWIQMEAREGDQKKKGHKKKKQPRNEGAGGQSQVSLAAAFLGLDVASDVAARTGSRRGKREGRGATRPISAGTHVSTHSGGGSGGGGGRESAPPQLPAEAEREAARSVVLPAL
jgi:hypothetical protein